LGGFNREISIGTSSQTFTAVCFNECNPCNVGVNEFMNTLEVYPNPFGDFIQLNGSVDGSLKIFNSIGQCIYSDNAAYSHRISTAEWPMGIYTLVNNHQKRKIIKH
jgi:hypothetical protein